jgi:membrane-associated phospholipid phosphatase
MYNIHAANSVPHQYIVRFIMNKIVVVFILCFCSFQLVFAEADSETSGENITLPNKTDTIPFSTLFYQFGANTLHSFTYNYGVNYLLSGLGTYYMVHSGLDWKWNRLAYNNVGLAYAGAPFGIIGFAVPVAIPLWMYFYGKSRKNPEYQITGLALGQAAILGLLVSSSIKTFTGRRPPGILDPGILDGVINGRTDSENYSADFAFGFMNRGVFDGWPSGHTAVAFAMATALVELYPNNLALRIGAYSYATLIGVGMSLFAHWASDSIAGALVGYSIGKSVGRSYKKLLNRSGAYDSSGGNISGSASTLPGLNITENLSVYFYPNDVGVCVRY